MNREKAKAYRERAEHVRRIARDMTDEAARKTLETVAEDYDRLASEIETSGDVKP